MGGLSGERKISFLTGKACSKALRKKGYKVKELDAKGYFVDKLKKLKPEAAIVVQAGQVCRFWFKLPVIHVDGMPFSKSSLIKVVWENEISEINTKNKVIICFMIKNV